MLRNMVGPGEVDDDLCKETEEECQEKYGGVQECKVHEVKDGEVVICLICLQFDGWIEDPYYLHNPRQRFMTIKTLTTLQSEAGHVKGLAVFWDCGGGCEGETGQHSATHYNCSYFTRPDPHILPENFKRTGRSCALKHESHLPEALSTCCHSVSESGSGSEVPSFGEVSDSLSFPTTRTTE